MRAGHARVGDRRGPAGLHARVGGLDMRVRSEDRGHPSVKGSSEGDLLARRLGVEVDEDDLGGGIRLGDQLVHNLERVDGDLEKERAHQVHHRHGRSVVGLGHREAAAGGDARHVSRTDHTVTALEVGCDLATPPGVVSERDHICPGCEEPIGELRRQSGAVGGILAGAAW